MMSYMLTKGRSPFARHVFTFFYYFFLFFIAQKVSNIHFVTKDFKIVPLTNLLKLFLAGRLIGGGVCLVRFVLMQQ